MGLTQTQENDSQLNQYIAEIRSGNLRYLPWLCNSFLESSNKNKRIAISILSEILNDFSIDDIRRIDKQMRHDTYYIAENMQANQLDAERLGIKLPTGDDKRILLAFESFHYNGYKRQQAIQTLHKYKNVLVFFLLRCDDCVPQVRQTAIQLLPQVLANAGNKEILFTLPLMEKLRKSNRCDYDTVFSMVMDLFQCREQLIKQGLNDKDVRTRKFCISVIGRMNNFDYSYLTDHLTHEESPFLRRVGFQMLLKTHAGGVDRLTLIKRFLKDKCPLNRIVAIRYFSDYYPQNTSEIAVGMLMDKNARIREFVRGMISQNEIEVDIRQLYLNFLPEHTAVSICGLGEVGLCQDCALIERFLTQNDISVVRAAMTALMRLNPEKYVSCITQMLAGPQTAIVKTAMLLLKKNKSYDCEKVLEILKNATDGNIKIKCAMLLFLSSKWKTLIYTLTMVGSGCEKLEGLCQTQISKWLLSFNRSFCTIPENDRKIIIELLNEKAAFLKEKTVKQIAFSIK